MAESLQTKISSRGATLFLGKPCKYGHSGWRYLRQNNPCVECRDYQARKNYVERGKARNVRNRERILALRRLRSGASQATRPEPERCECCGSEPNMGARLRFDHDHVTGAFRGWLCGKCNTAIGKLGDDIAGVERALRYLKRAQQ